MVVDKREIAGIERDRKAGVYEDYKSGKGKRREESLGRLMGLRERTKCV